MRYARIAAVGFVLTLLSALGLTLYALEAQRAVVASEELARERALALADVERLRYLVAQEVAADRAFLLTADERFRAELFARREEFLRLQQGLDGRLPGEESQRLLDEVAQAEVRLHDVVKQAFTLRERTRSTRDEVALFLREVKPLREALDVSLDTLAARTRQQMEAAHGAALAVVEQRTWKVVSTAAAVLLLGVLLAGFLTWYIAHRDEAQRRLVDAVVQQSREMEEAFVALRTERDAARAEAAGRIPPQAG